VLGKITKSLLWTAPKSLVFCHEILFPCMGEGVALKRRRKRGNP